MLHLPVRSRTRRRIAKLPRSGILKPDPPIGIETRGIEADGSIVRRSASNIERDREGIRRFNLGISRSALIGWAGHRGVWRMMRKQVGNLSNLAAKRAVPSS